MGHHGGATNAKGFFEAVGAEAAVISAGEGNDYGHPTRTVLDALRGAEVRRTDIEGTVEVTVGARELRNSAARASQTGR